MQSTYNIIHNKNFVSLRNLCTTQVLPVLWCLPPILLCQLYKQVKSWDYSFYSNVNNTNLINELMQFMGEDITHSGFCT